MNAPSSSLAALSPAHRQRLESLVVSFDQSWHARRLPEAVATLPSAGDPLRLPALVEMIKVDLARQWQVGQRRFLEDYLKAYPELGTADTVAPDLVKAEFQARKGAGDTAELAHFAERFPRQAQGLRSLIEAPMPVMTAALDRATLAPSGRPASSPSSELPEAFGRYRILKLLGQGGMGSVFLAQDTQLERQVALKVPKFEASDGPQVLERFFREARAAATLHHPNICPVFDVGAEGGTHYLTMAYIEGKPLTDFIRAGKGLPASQAAALVRKIALALDEAHRHGIVHRDLKPANIMINQRKEPVIMDFGLARQTSKEEARITKSGAVVGTPAYMSPEQVTAKEVGPPSDIYSLGVILYEMLTGRLPFDGPMMAVLSQILLDDPQPPSKHHPGLDPRLEAICLKALTKDPGKRQATMAELAAALGQFLSSSAKTPAAATPATESVTPATTAEVKKTGTIKPVPTVNVGEFEELVAVRPAKKRKAKTKAQPLHLRPWPWIAAAAVLVGALGIWLLAGVVLRVQTKNGIVELHINEPGAQVFVDEELKITLTSPSDKEPIRIEIPEGKHTMKVVKGGFVTETKEFTLRPGTPQEIRVVLRPDPVVAGKNPDPPPGKELDWVALFNGKDLAGWKLHPAQWGNWKVENGNLVGRGPDVSHLFTERDDYTDFHFLVEAKINAKGNSGQLFRVQFQPGIPLGYEAQIDSGSHGTKTGTLYVLAGKGQPQGGMFIKEVLVPPDTWFTQEVIAKGNHIIIKVNDKVVVDFVDKKNTYSRGHLALQVFDPPTLVEFRQVKVKELKPATGLPGGVSLFNGKDLTGWKTHPSQPGGWTVEDGYLVGRNAGASAHLFTERGDFENFHLHADVKINAQGNSGIYFRSSFDLDRVGNFPTAYEAQILHSHSKALFLTGCLRIHGTPRVDLPNNAQSSVAADEWFTLDVIVQGNHLIIKVNGTVTVDALDPEHRYRKGHLVLQAMTDKGVKRPSVVHFRKIEIKELPAEVKAPADGWVSLFNGTDLTGWKTHPQAPDNWRVANGLLIGAGPKGNQLFTERDDYQDGHFRVEARINAGGNSGQYIRSAFKPGIGAWGYEAQINSTANDARTGSLYGRVNVSEVLVQPGEWFTQEIIAVGNHIVIKVNGKTTVDFTDQENRFARGHLGLQMHGPKTLVEFRKVEVKELKAGVVGEPGFVSLFNGTDLTGWQGDQSYWSVAGGAIVGAGTVRNYLSTTKTYRDFILKAKVKPIAGDSSIMFRGKPNAMHAMHVFTGMFGATGDSGFGNLMDETPLEYKGKTIFLTDRKDAKRQAQIAAIKKENDWNDLVITAIGEQIRVAINGSVVFDGKYVGGPKEGVISLKVLPKAQVAFKDLQIKEVLDGKQPEVGAVSGKLFNGVDLANFYTYLSKLGKNNDPDKVFTVADGMLRISGQHYGTLTTEREHENYHLVVEYKWGDKTWPPRYNLARNSGIMLHGVGDHNTANPWMEAIECQLAEGAAGDLILVKGASQPRFKAHAQSDAKPNHRFNRQAPLTEISSGRLNWFGRDPAWQDIKGFRGKFDQEARAGEWNIIECVCDGGAITVMVNRKIVNEAQACSHTKGKISIQSEGAELFIRRIELIPMQGK